MTNCIFYSLIFALFLSFTDGAINFSKINRTFLSIYRGIFEASTVSVDDSGEPVEPFFDEHILKIYLSDYLKDNLNPYCKEYTVKLYFFNRDDDTICFNNMCRDVSVTLKAEINYLFNYNKTQIFSVYSRDELWMKN